MFGVALALIACSVEPDPSDAQLGLNPQQVQGRRIFRRECSQCHTAYSSRSLRGPSLQGLFKKPFMSSGIPANDDRVRDVVLLGRGKMPGFSRVLNSAQMENLLAYLHTL